ncbi:MAG: hypothetical protein K8R69_03405, partial [Deltaproteobacteria bacterium]|nr:hypothetical protein [Deltaproteobacteria bacterium]
MKSAESADNLYYLPNAANHAAAERELEKLIRSLAKRLGHLEKDLGKHLRVIEKELGAKQSTKNGTQEKIYKELKDLQSRI